MVRALPLLLCVAGIGAIAVGWRSVHVALYQAGLWGLAMGLVALALRGSRAGAPAWLSPACLFPASVLATLGVAELGLSAWRAVDSRRPAERPPSYEEAQTDAKRLERWWRHHLRGWARLDPALFERDPTGRQPHRPIPGASITRGGSTIHINRLGFRGPEISSEKRNRFRVVALGESTTFGLTWLASDRPWPLLLEEYIESRLECDRPVEVVNGGVPGWTLANQLGRLDREIFPLEPDLLVAYHGYNGFRFFMRDLPGVAMLEPGQLPRRASFLVGILERAWVLRGLRQRQPALSEARQLAEQSRARGSTYWKLYRELVHRARQRGVEVALCSFNLAVTPDSPEGAIAFYEPRYPDVRSSIIANLVHHRIVQQVPRTHFIDTSPGLDGAFQDAYIDLVHFTQAGRERLAEHVFDGLRPTLEGHPRLNCRPRAAP